MTLWLWRTVPCVQLLIGTFGNIMNVVILSRRRIRKYSTTVYLICLAVADLTILWTMTFPKMLQYGFDIYVRAENEVLCRVLPWLSYSAGSYSVLLLAAVTIERLILTRWPVYARSNLNRRKSFTAALSILVFTSALSAHLPFGYQIQISQLNISNETTRVPICSYVSEEYRVFYKTAWAWTIFFFLNVVMILLIAIGNGTILITLCQQKKKLLQATATYDKQPSKDNRFNRSKSSTKMVFVISLSFILTTLPHTIYRVISGLRISRGDGDDAVEKLQDTVTILLLYCTFTFNFLLYCVSGSVFKEELRAFLSETVAKLRVCCTKSVKKRHISVTPITSSKITNSTKSDTAC